MMPDMRADMRAHSVRTLALLEARVRLRRLSTLVTLPGRISGTARTFLSLFLFGLYLSLNISKAPLADVVGFHGVATSASVLAWLGMGIVSAWGGHLWNQYRL
jgi:hypothetical protein